MRFSFSVKNQKRWKINDSLSCEYFGFLDTDVDMLFERYEQEKDSPEITREDLHIWYDGYCTVTGKRLYNPRSVVCALTENKELMDKYNELLLSNDNLGYVHRLAKDL